MQLNVAKEQAALERLSACELRQRFAEVFGESTRANNRIWLIRRILWRLQANAEGDLSERARQRATELANDADLRTTPPRERPHSLPPSASNATSRLVTDAIHRLPLAGTVLIRKYKGRDMHVTVLDDGFEFQGDKYDSLSAVAKAITGTHTNGFLFFKLGQYGDNA